MIEKIDKDLYYDERSAGGVVYKKDGKKIMWLIIKTMGIKSDYAIFKFPKGHMIGHEFLKQTALREVEEEGRIKAKIISKLASNNYIIWDKIEKKKIIKKVTFFLMEYVGESNLRHFDKEMVLDREWFTQEEAMKRLAYDSEKVLLSKAVNKVK